MRPSHTDQLLAELSEHDRAVLLDVFRFRLLTTRHIQRLHFDEAHRSALASTRACTRTLSRLRTTGVLRPLERRIGGARAGSASHAWFVGPAGEGVLRALDVGRGGRHNYQEPSRHFVEHTLAVAEASVQIIEAHRAHRFELLDLTTEPSNWRQALSRFGTTQWLKPDLHLVIADGEYEHHWFIEIDLATEHLPVVLRQCAAYEAYRATGRYQAAHGLFPIVLWVTPTQARKAALSGAIAATASLSCELFQVCAAEELLQTLTGPHGQGI
jgi:Replication-relaxation